MSELSKTYQDGVREGKIMTLEMMQNHHGRRLDSVEKKISTLERVSYTLLGAVALIQFAPALKGFFV